MALPEPTLSRRSTETSSYYQLMFDIEVSIREFIVQNMDGIVGKKWLKQRVPPDVFINMKGGKEREQSSPLRTAAIYHPIYYSNFSDLSKIILRTDNWKEIFVLFFKDRRHVEDTLSQLEPIRNKIAHARILSHFEENLIRIIYVEVQEFIGEPISDYVDRSFNRNGLVVERVSDVKSELERLVDLVKETEPISISDILSSTSDIWWLDNNVVDWNIQNVSLSIDLLRKYSFMARGRGQGYLIEAWCNDTSVVNITRLAINELNDVIKTIFGS